MLYHVKLVRVRRGLYAVVPPGASAESYPVDPFLLASRMAKDAVQAYHTALEFHGEAYSVYEYFTLFISTAPSLPGTQPAKSGSLCGRLEPCRSPRDLRKIVETF